MVCEYIEISTRNMNNSSHYHNLDEILLVFDIDYTLFYSKKMKLSEFSYVKNEFISMPNSSEKLFLENQLKYNEYKEAFYKILNINPSECCKRLEDPEIEKFVKPDPELKEILRSLRCRKICFTNSSKKRSSKILKYLEVEQFFEAVLGFDLQEKEFSTKPKKEAYEFVEIFLSKNVAPNKIYFFDDTKINVEEAKRRGWNAFHVSDNLTTILKDLIQRKEIF